MAFVLAFSWGLQFRRGNREVGIYHRGSEQSEGFLVVSGYIRGAYAPVKGGYVASISTSLRGGSVRVTSCGLELQEFAFAEAVTLKICPWH